MQCVLQKNITIFGGQYPTFSFNENYQKYTNITPQWGNFDNYQFFPLMNLLGEIIELYSQYGYFLETVMPTLNKEMENKSSMLKIDVSCYFHSSPTDAFKTLLSI